MEKQAFIDELKDLSSREDLLSVSREINDLKTRFGDFIIEEERKDQVAKLEAQERGEEVSFEKEADPLKDEFYAIYSEFKEKRKALIDEKNAAESKNLSAKKALIVQLKTLVAEEENIGSLFGKRNEIHEEWKKIGNLPRDKQEEIQNEYSKITEDFFYNVSIYKELKDFDLKRNFQLKNAVIEQMAKLTEVENMREVENSLRTLQNEWEEAGPVGKDEWEELKEKYWTNVRLVREKLNAFYDERRNELKENLDKKLALLDDALKLNGGLAELSTPKEWEDKTAELLVLQNEWKKIGFGPKKENEDAWKAFRAACDLFFDTKKQFYETIRSEFDELAAKKQKLVDQALALKENTNWKETSDKLIQLQKQWKSIGHAGQKNEQRLWKDFRGACDSFFTAKQKHFEDQDKANETNLAAKQQIIDQIKNYKGGSDKKQILADLREFSAAFTAVGHVPMAEKDRVYKEYKTALDGHYDQLKLEGAEKDKVYFQAKLDSLKADPNPERAITREKDEMRKQIDTLKHEIIQFENNLGFFAKSKGADALKKEVENKINHSKRKIEDLKNKIKMLSHE